MGEILAFPAIWLAVAVERFSIKGCSHRSSCWQNASFGPQNRKTRKTGLSCTGASKKGSTKRRSDGNHNFKKDMLGYLYLLQPITGKLYFCEACAEGNSYRAVFKPVGEVQSKKWLELVNSDVAGPMKVESFGSARYFVTFIDDCFRCVTVYLFA